MREQLISYVDLLFAGTDDAGEIKQEILQNTLDRYDDLLDQGKSPQAAYRLAISGIGDIHELLNDCTYSEATAYVLPVQKNTGKKPAWKKALQAIGICIYIMCPIPLLVLGNATGLSGLLALVAVATALMVISGEKSTEHKPEKEERPLTPREELRKAVKTMISVIGLCCYLGISFATGAWYITWLIFPIMGALQGLARACMDLKEAD